MECTTENREKLSGPEARLRRLTDESLERLREQARQMAACADGIEEQVLSMRFQTENVLRMAEIRRVAKSLSA